VIETDEDTVVRAGESPEASPGVFPGPQGSAHTGLVPAMEMAVTAAGSLPSYANGHEPVYDREAGEEEGSTMIEMGSPRGSADGHPLEPNAMRIETSLHEGTNERVNEMSGADIAKYFAGIVAVFILFTVIGSASGPPRLLTSRTYNEVTTDVLSKRPVFLSGIHFNSDLPQFFFMEMSFENKKNARMKVTLDLAIQVDLRRERGGPVVAKQVYSTYFPVDCAALSTCAVRRMLYYPTVDYKEYSIYTKIMSPQSDWDWIGKVNFAYTYKNLEFTRFEVNWRYFFTAVGVTAWVAYLYVCHVSQARRYTIEQIWLTYLLGLLICLNAPWYGVSLTTKNWLLVFITAASHAFFLAAIILYWLIVLDIAGREQSFTPDFQSFYLPKAAFVGVGALFMTGYYTWLTWYQYEDATATAETRLGGSYTTVKYLLVVYLILFVVWVLWYLVQACRALTGLSVRSQALLGYTLLSMLGFFCTLLTRYVSGQEENNAAIFVAFSSLCNLYVLGLAYFCHPRKRTQHVNVDGLAAGVNTRA